LAENRKKLIVKLAGITEMLILAFLYYRTFDSYRAVMGRGLFLFRGKILLIGLYVIIGYVVFRVCESFSFDKSKKLDLSISQCISCLFVNGITWVQLCLINNGMLPAKPMLQLSLVQFVVCILFSVICVIYFQKTGGIRDALLIGGTEAAFELQEKFEHKEGNYHISECVKSEDPFAAICGAIDRHMFVIINDVPAETRNDLLKYCFAAGKTTYVVPKITDILMKGTEEVSAFDTPLMHVKNEGIGPMEAFIKRTVDIVCCLIAMIPCSVIMLAIAVAIKLEDHGPVFYTQKRLTKDGRVFDILKFRSMIVDAEKNTGAVLAGEHDSRITKVGRFLRACRLDELPQLLNILKGDMSIVGPRPERVELTAKIMEEMPEFAYRTKVKAGLTGYAQVYGKYNTTNYDKLRLDLMYIEQYSLLLDLKLILMTPQILLRKEATEGVKEKKN